MNQIWPIGTEIWFRTDKKCEQTDATYHLYQEWIKSDQYAQRYGSGWTKSVEGQMDGQTTSKLYPSDNTEHIMFAYCIDYFDLFLLSIFLQVIMYRIY